MILFVLNSCGLVKTFVPELFYPNPDKDRFSRSGVDSTATKKPEVVKDVLSRPINNRVKFFDEILLIPRGTWDNRPPKWLKK